MDDVKCTTSDLWSNSEESTKQNYVFQIIKKIMGVGGEMDM